jgi:2-phospho-L-lactate guanylyltransferase
MIAGLVPVKDLERSKSRLLPELGPQGARRLAVAMLGDVIEALRGVPRLARVAVVTPDAAAAEVARREGAEVLLRADPGLNAAVDAAAGELAPDARDGLLVVLGDVAGARAGDLEALLDALEGPGVAIAPSSDGGTSALLRRPARAIPAAFGPASAKRHRELAERERLPFHELALPSLALDVDEPEDLARLRAAGCAGRRTRALLGPAA